MLFKIAQNVHQIFGLLLKENLLLRTIENRPIWTHWHCGQSYHYIRYIVHWWMSVWSNPIQLGYAAIPKVIKLTFLYLTQMTTSRKHFDWFVALIFLQNNFLDFMHGVTNYTDKYYKILTNVNLKSCITYFTTNFSWGPGGEEFQPDTYIVFKTAFILNIIDLRHLLNEHFATLETFHNCANVASSNGQSFWHKFKNFSFSRQLSSLPHGSWNLFISFSTTFHLHNNYHNHY